MNSKQSLETDVASVSSMNASQMANTDLVPLFRPNATTGRDELIGKIPRSELMAAVQSSLGTILAGTNKGQTIDRVPTLNSGSFGSSTIADLAAVLGALANFQAAFLNNATVLTSGQNVNNLGAGYYFSFSTAVIQSLSNVPSGLEQEIVLFCAPRITTNPYGYQILWALHQDVVYIRHYHNQSGWSTWARIDTNIPSFYKNYNDLFSLVQGVGGVVFTDVSSLNGDLNNARPMILYSLMGTSITSLANKPFSGSQNVIYIGNDQRGIQISCAYDGSKISLRCKWDIWRNWVSII